MCIDPLAEKYPYNSTYAFQENKMGMGVELEGLELASRNPVSGFGNYVKGKFDSAVSSIQTTTAKTVQAVSNALSSLEVNQVDGYNMSSSVSKGGISESTGFFNEASGAKSSGNIDGDFVQAIADAFSPQLSGVMDGANIASGLVQDFGNPIAGLNTAGSNKTTASNSASGTTSSSNGGTVTVQKGTYSATGTVGNTSSTVNRKVRDTVVKTSDAAKVKAQNTKDSIKAVNENNKINANTNFTD